MNTVDGVLNRNLRAEAERRGYIVVAPAAPNGELFSESGARISSLSEGRSGRVQDPGRMGGTMK